LSIQARLVAAGLSGQQAAAIQGTAGNSLTASGTNQGTAFALEADLNRFTTVASGTGAILPTLLPGDSMEVFNDGSNALLLYPPSGGAINALSVNAAYSIATTTPYCSVRCISPTQYQAMQSS
jgi:hypothetical protein